MSDDFKNKNRFYRSDNWLSMVRTGIVFIVGSLIPLWVFLQLWVGKFDNESISNVTLFALFLCYGFYCVIMGFLRRQENKVMSIDAKMESNQCSDRFSLYRTPSRNEIIVVIIVMFILFCLLLNANIAKKEVENKRLSDGIEMLKRNLQEEISVR